MLTFVAISKTITMHRSFYFLIPLALLIGCAGEKLPETDRMAALYAKSIVIPGITYVSHNGDDLKLDAWIPATNLGEPPWVSFSADPKPVLLYIHGGGWKNLSRSVRNLNIIPYVDKGFAVVNIDYRLLTQAPFPGCIADCRYALNWIYDHAEEYRFDTTRIVVSGESAGGHLALMTGMLPNDSAISIPGRPIHRKMHVAAIVNWYGVSDLAKIAAHWNSPEFNRLATAGSATTEEIFRISSPVTYATGNNPPVLSIHGDKDETVPIEHSELLHRELEKRHVKNRIVRIEGRKHGDFTEEEMTRIFREIWSFLHEAGVI